MKKKQYEPQYLSFPYLTIHYLYVNGESKVKDIRKAIGLDEHTKKTSFYSDRSSYFFAHNILHG